MIVVVLFETPSVWHACCANMCLRILYTDNMDVCMDLHMYMFVYADRCALKTNSTGYVHPEAAHEVVIFVAFAGIPVKELREVLVLSLGSRV
jgi:hypothetical protein